MVAVSTGLRGLCGVVFALGFVYAVLLLPGVRPTPGYDPLIDAWLNLVVDALVIVAVLGAGVGIRRERAAWFCIGASLLASFAASLSYYLHYRFQDPYPTLSWADLGWVSSYVLLYAGLVLMLRPRVQRWLPSLWLDGVVAGLTATALAVAYLDGAGIPTSSDPAGVATLYPILDLLMLALGVAVLAMLGRAAGTFWWLVCAAFIVYAITDALYAARLTDGTYVAGGPLDLGWLVPRLCLVAAVWISLRSREHRQRIRLEHVNLLRVPVLCALGALAVLFHGTQTPLPDAATGLALAAGLGVVARTLLTFREVRELGEERRQARTDDLTGLANRRHFYLRLDHAATDLDRRPCVVALVDLDKFREVNDALGPKTGDELLCLVGQRLGALCRPDHVLARLGGDEYAVLMPGASPEDARALAARMWAALRQPFLLGPASLTIDASIGLAAGPAQARTATELVQKAGLAMSAAKEQCDGPVLYDETLHSRELDRLERVAQLSEGIRGGQLEMHYQPQVDLRSGAAVGLEALVRWRHPVEGLLPPVDFIGLAESSGLMGALTEVVLEQALSQRYRWQQEGIEVRVAVNVSPSALVDHTFAARVEQLLAAHQVPGEALVIEVTEDLLLDSPERAMTAFAALRDAGVLLSVDDYGTGFSGLSYLRVLPVSELKLDRSFVASMTSSVRSATIVDSTIDLARALGLSLVAEGVEDAATLDLLVDAGCDLAQGYFLGRPVPAGDVPAALLEATRRHTDARAHASSSPEPVR